MRITPKLLAKAASEAEKLAPGECVHIWKDGSCTTGTEYESTTPSGPDEIVATYHPGRSDDPWDCLKQTDEAETV